jgi:hypothetical protein
MAGMSNYAEQQLLDWYFRRATWTGADPYIRLYSTNPTDFEANPPTGGTEMVGTGYTQYGQLAARGSTNWEVVASGNGMVGQNKPTSAFSWSVGSDWPAMNGAALFDGNASGSNLIWGGALTTPRDPSTGDTAHFSAGAIQLKLDVTTLAGVSIEAKTAILQHLLIGDQSANRVPATAYLAVYTSATAIDLMTGANGTEVSTSGTNYSRAAITSSTFWTAAAVSGTGYKITNAAAVNSWSAAGTAWGTCRYVALVDTASGPIGHYYAIKQLTSDVQIDAGDTFSIAAGGISISLDESN